MADDAGQRGSDEGSAAPSTLITVPRTRLRRGRRRPQPGGLLSTMRVRKKVLFLHTLFSLGLAAVLLVPLRPAIIEVVEQAEASEARVLLRLVLAERGPGSDAESLAARWLRLAPDATLLSGTAEDLGLMPSTISQTRATPESPVTGYIRGGSIAAVAYAPGRAGEDEFWALSVRIAEARRAVWELYALTAAALLAVYALVAAALELFVLPQHVYGPIQKMLDADQAVEDGRPDDEIIPEGVIPADELGEIMRSRNRAVSALRSHEQALAEALGELERVANDLKRKNHLLEAAQRNLADADRLASLGMMSAGIAHELNTPLAVVKGLAERVNSDPEHRLDPASAALLVRVVNRLERLGESLLDFARVRSPRSSEMVVRALVDEALTLVRLDREMSAIDLVNLVPESLVVECDGDRMVQVLVNLVRNSADAIGAQRPRARRPREPRPPSLTRAESGSEPRADRPPGAAQTSASERGRIEISADTSTKDGRLWASIRVRDDGPGIHPEVLSRLFEPFASTRLDAHGTGLGLAVAEGIVREHGGLILARNRAAASPGQSATDAGPPGNPPSPRGAEFEIMLPVRARPYPEEPVQTVGSATAEPARAGLIATEPVSDLDGP